MKRICLLSTLLVFSLAMGLPADAGPVATQKAPAASPAATKATTAPAKATTAPAKATPGARPDAAPVGAPNDTAPTGVVVEPPARLPGAFDPSVDLKRLGIGNQAGLLKVFHRDTGAEAYFRTLDDRNSAFFTAEQRRAIYEALALAPDEVEPAARQVMIGYPKLPKRAVLAFLGAIGSDPDLAPGFRELLQRYLAERYATEKDNILRRQALLSLALMHRVDAEAVELVLQVFETESNLWVTFPVQMFFEHHAEMIRELAHVESIRGRAGAVNSLYTENVIKSLGAPASATPAPVAPPVEVAPSAAVSPSAGASSADPGGAALPAQTGTAPL